MIEVTDISSFDDIYKIMASSFPESERRSEAGQRALFADGRYKAAVKRGGDGEIVAFVAYWQLDGVTFLEHFAVDGSLRGGGLGGAFLDELIAGLDLPIVLEVEPPETHIAARRIAFYERHGFIVNDYPYLQPPLGEGRAALPLKVMSYGAALTEAQFERARASIYAAVYRADVEKYK